MDASGLSQQEAAVLEGIMQKKQASKTMVCDTVLQLICWNSDERLYATLLGARRAMLHGLRYRFYNDKAKVVRRDVCEPLRRQVPFSFKQVRSIFCHEEAAS
jgi:hypothetical protein